MPAYVLEKYTYEDYKQWEGDWELIDGIPQAMAPSPALKHQFIIMKLGYLMNKKVAIFEVISPSTKLRDEITKKTIYQKAGVKNIFLVYPDEKKVIFNNKEIDKIEINTPCGMIEFESKEIFKGL